MIRKPTEKDFREGATVAVLRETGRVAVATRDGARKGAQALAWLYVRFILWVGVVGSTITALAQGSVIGALMLVGLALGIHQVLRKKDQARLEPEPKVVEQYQHVVIHASLRRDGVNGDMDWYCPARA